MLKLEKTFSIRKQLLGLFSLMVFAFAGLLLLDEWERQKNTAALEQLKNDSLSSLRRIKAVSDAFGLDVVTGLCEQLRAGGAPALHFYTMNQSVATLALCERLG